MFSLRPYQKSGVAAIRESFHAGKRAPLYVLPTGGGKTVVFSYIAATTAARAKNTLVLNHRIELIRQTSRSLRENNVHHGIINPKYTADLMANTQVASVQTLIRRLHKYNFIPDLIIIDECHHAVAGTWRKIIESFPKARVLGVTATPCRGDGKGLGAEVGGIFDDIIIGPQIYELIEDGYLTRPVVYAPSEKLDLSEVKTRMGDYDTQQLVELIDKPAITGHAVEYYTKLCPYQPAVVFCVNVKHAEHVAEEFRRAGYSAYSVDGTQDSDTRERILGGLENGSVHVVASCDLISEGTDIPAIVGAFLLRPTQSTGLFLQQVGRALRPIFAPGFDIQTKEGRFAAIAASTKTKAIIVDHVGNIVTHGLPDEERDWSLEGVIKKKRSRQELGLRIVQCHECYAMFEPCATCPECGAEMKSGGALTEVPETGDGELRQVTEEDKLRLKRKRLSEQGQAQSEEDLIALASSRGYTNPVGWAKHMIEYRNKKGKLKAIGVKET